MWSAWVQSTTATHVASGDMCSVQCGLHGCSQQQQHMWQVVICVVDNKKKQVINLEVLESQKAKSCSSSLLNYNMQK